MANLKDIRNRISSVKSTRQITNAMKMVSAAKLRKAQNTITQLRPYANKLNEILSRLGDVKGESAENIYAVERTEEHVLLVAISSNRGLCGPFNANVVKKVIELTEGQYAEQYKKGNVSIYTIGSKSEQILHAKGFKIDAHFNKLYDNLTFNNIAETAEKLMALFTNKKFDKIEFIYNRFKNAAVQILTQEQFLPVKHTENNSNNYNDYIFEPSQQYIFDTLIPDSLKTQLFAAISDSYAAEQGARMTAMHQATDNAGEMIRSLTLSYNKARQAAITKEILEITAGAEALKG
ncbi:MAG: ATP synthase F1 subunit gamma [Bacteroidales bacterium]|nr:ATP synthase F1 subunit gamma [Bacteroidales bacterium]